ncbi:MAG: glycosyltransferase family 2 protein [Candidatus Margulisiibacteriota bacterium]
MQPFSIIVPVYNEEEILENNTAKLIAYSNRLGVEYEIILVSNGSTDTTEEVGGKLDKQYPNVKFCAIPDKGVGRAFKKGIEASKHEHIIFMDADLSAELSFIEKANQQLDAHVLVLGTKINGLQNRSLFRKMGSFVFFLSVRLLMGLTCIDYAPGAKAYRRSFLIKYFSFIDDFTSFVLNLTYIAVVKKEPILEISIVCDDRRKSRFNLWHEAVSKYRGLITLKLMQLRGQL